MSANIDKYIDIISDKYVKYKDINISHINDVFKRDRIEIVLGEWGKIFDSDDFPQVILGYRPLHASALYWGYKACLKYFDKPCIGLSNKIPLSDLPLIIVHEYQHYLDDIKTGGKYNIGANIRMKGKQSNIYDKPKDYKIEYYNSWHEINAFIRSYRYKYGNNISHINNFEGYEYLTDRSKRRIINRLITDR